MNMKMEYLVKLLNLSEKIAFNLNYYIDNAMYELGIDYINNLNLEDNIKDKLIKVFLSYKISC